MDARRIALLRHREALNEARVDVLVAAYALGESDLDEPPSRAELQRLALAFARAISRLDDVLAVEQSIHAESGSQGPQN